MVATDLKLTPTEIRLIRDFRKIPDSAKVFYGEAIEHCAQEYGNKKTDFRVIQGGRQQ